MPTSLKLEYPAILDSLKSCLVPGRTESHAFLVWFLQHSFRLDETEAQDSVCDGPDDKGVDGIYIDENLETVVIFQCRLVQNAKRTLGDTTLKEFIGTLSQFRDPNTIGDIAASTANAELAKLLTSANVAKLVDDGFSIKGAFITNIDRDANAIAYLQGTDDLRLFDNQELESHYIPVGPTEPVGTPVAFDVFGYDCAQYQIGDVKVIFAPLKGNDLIRLDGIASSELFAWNVRGSLGRTKVNKDIGRSIDDPTEHKNFLLYHNGLTVLCERLDRDGDKIIISKYSVVNGCQSLTSLHSNNQNPINARDLQSSSTIQRRLQNEFSAAYGGKVFYRIKRGEPDQAAAQVIDNDEAGRLLLAFDRKEPWTCHQSYKILDELHAEIFARPEVNAYRIVAVTDLH